MKADEYLAMNKPQVEAKNENSEMSTSNTKVVKGKKKQNKKD